MFRLSLATANRRRAYSPCGCCIRRPPGTETPSMRPNIRHKKPRLDGGGTAVCGVSTLRGGVCYRCMDESRCRLRIFALFRLSMKSRRDVNINTQKFQLGWMLVN
ncbi:hypothetical protein XavaCFBP5823_18410 [Xanthomonas axonopodis pv. vasculorum]|nr:hypothetical protein XavaCFBP5823_18410 [Xanthomonas axonopodis pv. vasculorum]